MLEQEPAIPAVELAQRMFGAGEVVVVGVEQRSVPLDKILEASETEFRRKKKKSIQRDGMGTTKKKKRKKKKRKKKKTRYSWTSLDPMASNSFRS